MVETISSFETIKGLSIEKHRKKIFEKLYTSSVNTTYQYNKLVILEVLLKDMVTSIGLIFIMYLGTKYVNNGIISLSSFITFSSLLIYFIEPIKNIIEVKIIIFFLPKISASMPFDAAPKSAPISTEETRKPW